MMIRPIPRLRRPRWPWVTYSLTALGVAVAFGGLFLWGLASGQSSNGTKITDLQRRITELCSQTADPVACRMAAPMTTVIVVPGAPVPTAPVATTTAPVSTSTTTRPTTTVTPSSSTSTTSTTSTSTTTTSTVPQPPPPSPPTTVCLIGLICR